MERRTLPFRRARSNEGDITPGEARLRSSIATAQALNSLTNSPEFKAWRQWKILKARMKLVMLIVILGAGVGCWWRGTRGTGTETGSMEVLLLADASLELDSEVQIMGAQLENLVRENRELKASFEAREGQLLAKNRILEQELQNARDQIAAMSAGRFAMDFDALWKICAVATVLAGIFFLIKGLWMRRLNEDAEMPAKQSSGMTKLKKKPPPGCTKKGCETLRSENVTLLQRLKKLRDYLRRLEESFGKDICDARNALLAMAKDKCRLQADFDDLLEEVTDLRAKAGEVSGQHTKQDESLGVSSMTGVLKERNRDIYHSTEHIRQ